MTAGLDEKKKKLAIAAPLKQWGGIERKVMSLCREFIARGVDVQLLLLKGGVVPYPDEFPAEVEVIVLKTRGKISSIFKLACQLRRDPPDALLTAKDHSAKTALVGRALSRVKVPVYVKITNTLSQTLRRRIKRVTARWLYRRADRLFCVSNGVADDLRENFNVPPERICAIYNPTVTPDIAERRQLPVNHPWLQGEGPPVIMGVGRLTKQKDFYTLIDAFALVRAKRPARLLILGEGTLHDSLEGHARCRGVGEYVDLPGYVWDPIPWLARTDLFVLSSRYEGLANVVIEALAAGAPVVSTDCPSGPAEILDNGRIGPLVPIGDPEAMAEAMERMLDEPPSQELLSEGLERFRSGVVAEAYLREMGLLFKQEDIGE